MKKNYFAPEMKIVKIKAHQTLMVGSVNMYGRNAESEAMATEYELSEDW